MIATAQHDTNATIVPTSEWRSEQLDVDAYLVSGAKWRTDSYGRPFSHSLR